MVESAGCFDARGELALEEGEAAVLGFREGSEKGEAAGAGGQEEVVCLRGRVVGVVGVGVVDAVGGERKGGGFREEGNCRDRMAGVESRAADEALAGKRFWV